MLLVAYLLSTHINQRNTTQVHNAQCAHQLLMLLRDVRNRFFLISVFLVRFLEKKLGFSPEWVWFGSMWKKRSRPPYGSDITHCLKNEPNLATCIFVEHRLVLTILGKQRQHTFRNYTHIQLSLSLHVCLLYLFFGLCGVRLSVCPSVCLSRSWILLKWIILWLIFFTVG